jgi:dipeptidyl aminopeptidase/acylaminoacyl peptidase
MNTPEEYLDALLSMPNIDDGLAPQVSPDGSWVAWTWFNVGVAADVFAAPTDGSRPPLRLTDTADNTFLACWTLDSQAVLVVEDVDGNERDRIFRIDLDQPLKIVPLTEADPNYFIHGGKLHIDGRWLVYGANFDFDTGVELEPTWIYRHDLETGERKALARPLKPAWTFPRLNHTGTHILYQRKDLHPKGIQVWLVDIEGQEDRELFNFGANVKTFASWHPDGEHILVMTETKTHRKLGITTLHESEIHWLLDDPQVDIENAWIPYNSRSVVVIVNQTGRLSGLLIDWQSGEIKSPPACPCNLIPLAPLPADLAAEPPREVDAEWVGLYFSAQQSAEVIRFRWESAALETFLSLSRTWEHTRLTPADLYPAEDFKWHSIDGQAIHGWLYRTPMQPKGTIVHVHGGPTYHSRDMLDAQIQFFVHQGFNVFDPNYRGSTGYGLPFREMILEDGWGGREQGDIRTGIEALIEAGIAQKGKIGITGTSYGGYSSWWAITHFPQELVAASAPICGMTDLVVDYQTTRPDLRPYSEEMIGGSPEQVPERYYERSPIHFIQNMRGSLLIVQGAQDPNVTPKNVEDVVKVLKDADISYEELIFEDEGHGISKRNNQRALYLRLSDFFRQAF